MRALVLTLVAVLAGSGAVADWPGFRGPRSDGSTPGAGVFSDRAPGDIGLTTRWSIPLGSGYSGPAIVGGRVFTQARLGDRDAVLAFDAATGKKLWHFDLEPTYDGHDGSHDGPIATPVVDGERVFGLGARGRLVALKVADGALLWSVELTEQFGATKPHYGFCSSPLLVSGALVVMLGVENAFVAGFDPGTGERLWATGTAQLAFQTPTRLTDDERELVLASGGDRLLAVDAAGGELVWDFEYGGSGGRGAASMTPVAAGEGRLFLAHQDDASKLVRWTRGEDGPVFETLWENRAIRNSYNIAVYHDGYLYAFSSRFLTCVDAETGEVAWRSREPGDGFLALVDDQLVVVTKNGSLHVIEATPEGYRERASLELFDDLIWTPPAFSDGSIFVRGLDGLARIDVSKGTGHRGDVEPMAELPADSGFARFLASVQAAGTPEAKGERVDAYLAAQSSFPILESGRVHFVYRGAARDVAIAGDLFGSRQDRPMHLVEGTDLFWISTPIEPDARVDYVFIPDFGEPVPDPLNPRQVVSTVFGIDMEIPRGVPGLTMSWLAGPAWESPAHVDAPFEDREGRIEEHTVEVEGLENPARARVWLPPDYDADAERRYPTLWIAGGEQTLDAGRFDELLANLVGRRIDPLIAVFLDVGAPDPGAGADIVADRIVPLVDETYRTIAERDARTLLGHGFPGFGAVLTAVKRPDTFSRVATQSLHFLDFMLGQLQPLWPEEGARPDVDVILEWSRYDLRNPHEAWDMREFNQRIATDLEAHGFRVERYLTSEGPGWTGWRHAAGEVMERLYPLSTPSTSSSMLSSSPSSATPG